MEGLLVFLLLTNLCGVTVGEHCLSKESPELTLDAIDDPGYAIESIRDLSSVEECKELCCDTQTGTLTI